VAIALSVALLMHVVRHYLNLYLSTPKPQKITLEE
jgi:hypothetical protein